MKIKQVHVYPNVTWATLEKDKIYDIAILELEKEVKLTPKVKFLFSNFQLDPQLQVLPICLPGNNYGGGSKVISMDFSPCFRTNQPFLEKKWSLLAGEVCVRCG